MTDVAPAGGRPAGTAPARTGPARTGPAEDRPAAGSTAAPAPTGGKPTAAELARLLDAERYPLQYHALVLEVTSRCNAACAMCYQSAGPAGSDLLGAAALGAADLSRVLREGREIAALDPRVHISGGEALLRVEPVVDLVAEAQQLGYREIVVTTNATWARSPRRALRTAAALRDAGLTALAVSWDHWHLPYIRPAWVEHCLRACAEVGLPTRLRVLTSRAHGVEEALAGLDAAALAHVDRISSGPVLPIGRAASALDPAELFDVGALTGACHTFLAVTVNAWGNVFPCCQGFDQTDTHLLGNVRDEPLGGIVARMSAAPLVRMLVLGGVARLYALLGEDIAADRSYRGICHACWSLFSDPAKVRRVNSALAELAAEAVNRS